MQSPRFVSVSMAAVLLITIPLSRAQSFGTAKGAGTANGSTSGTPANGAATDSATPTVCTVPDPSGSAAGSSPSGKGGKSADKSDGSTTPATSGSVQTPTVQVTVNTVAAANSNKQQIAGGTPGITSIKTQTLSLPDGKTNAVQIAAKLSSVSKSVISAIPVDPSHIVVALDTSPKSANAGNVIAQLQEFVNATAQPDPNVFAVVLPAGTGKACDVAHALIGSIPGIASITAVDDTRLLVTAATPSSLPSPGLAALVGGTAAPRVHQELESLQRQPAPKAQRDPTALLNSIVVTSVSVNTRLGAELHDIVLRIQPTPANPYPTASYKDKQRLIEILQAADESLEMRVKRLAAQLATPTVPTAPKVDSIVQRLYYFHDPAAVATLINNSFPNVQAQAIQPDTVVLSDPADLDDDARHSALKSAQRTITRLDQPRPQVSVDAWSLQLATTNEHHLGRVIPSLEDLAGNYNIAIDRSIGYGWNYLSQQISNPANLDPMMLDYLTYTTRINEHSEVERWNQSWSSVAPPPLDYDPGYGLGFASLYYPLTPNLLDMLVTFASLKYPSQAVEIIDKMETPLDSAGHQVKAPHGHVKGFCRERDEDSYGIKDKNKKDRALTKTAPQTMQLECVYDALRSGLLVEQAQPTATSALGQFRAALADFLFQYKLMVEYPDDFHSYLEPIAADTLDSAFQPIVEAFNEDLSVFQAQLQAQIAETLRETPDITYGYGGVVSVKVLGNQLGSVTTSTQNYFDATPAPTLNDLLSNLQNENATAQKSPLTSLLSSVPQAKAVELLTVLGQTLTPKPTTAHLGRGLDMSVTAHTLSGAYGAELDLSVKSTENGASLTQAGSTTTTDDLNSRVSQHTIDTHVRVDTLKLFKISTLSAVLARGQAPWKPIDPLFEVSALGLLIKRPLKPKEVYTQSLVFVDAMVVPTAADLGFGVPLIEDQIKLEDRRYSRLKNLDDFPDHLGERILQYHERVVDCLNREYLGTDGFVHVWENNVDQHGCFPAIDHNLPDYDAVKVANAGSVRGLNPAARGLRPFDGRCDMPQGWRVSSVT